VVDVAIDASNIIQIVIALISLTSVILILFIFKRNRELEQQKLFHDLVDQERDLRLILWEINSARFKDLSDEEIIQMDFEYDSLLFNFYEYLALVIYSKIIPEKYVLAYFERFLFDVYLNFKESILFEEGTKIQPEKGYKHLIWLFRRLRFREKINH